MGLRFNQAHQSLRAKAGFFPKPVQDPDETLSTDLNDVVYNLLPNNAQSSAVFGFCKVTVHSQVFGGLIVCNVFSFSRCAVRVLSLPLDWAAEAVCRFQFRLSKNVPDCN